MEEHGRDGSALSPIMQVPLPARRAVRERSGKPAAAAAATCDSWRAQLSPLSRARAMGKFGDRKKKSGKEVAQESGGKRKAKEVSEEVKKGIKVRKGERIDEQVNGEQKMERVKRGGTEGEGQNKGRK